MPPDVAIRRPWRDLRAELADAGEDQDTADEGEGGGLRNARGYFVGVGPVDRVRGGIRDALANAGRVHREDERSNAGHIRVEVDEIEKFEAAEAGARRGVGRGETALGRRASEAKLVRAVGGVTILEGADEAQVDIGQDVTRAASKRTSGARAGAGYGGGTGVDQVAGRQDGGLVKGLATEANGGGAGESAGSNGQGEDG